MFIISLRICAKQWIAFFVLVQQMTLQRILKKHIIGPGVVD
uniref:Uncharacterized protein n=1 Tax=Arundo donax TaxID=35708 RepID=A0A0A9GGN7_ARUDO